MASSYYRPTRAEISLDALQHNIEAFRRTLPDSIRIMAVVKGNGYGHGAAEIAREAVRCGAEYLGVAFLDEALELRRAGMSEPILVLGYTPPSGLEAAREYGVTLAAYTEDVLQGLLDMGRSDLPPLKVHVKIDTGMGRLGLVTQEEALSYIDRLLQTEGVQVEGVFTHYACADETDKSFTLAQHARFMQVIEHYRLRGIEFPIVHAGNSATAIDTPELTCNLVRLGISMYGLYPSDEVRKERIALKPVMRLVSTVTMVKELPPGHGVSYGATYVTKGKERIATLAVGYADGYTRMLTGKAEVSIHGRRFPIVGRICMDQCMVLLDDETPVRIGDEAVLFGDAASGEVSVDELADKLGTINYELTCMVSNRVPRIYRKNGQVTAISNPLI